MISDQTAEVYMYRGGGYVYNPMMMWEGEEDEPPRNVINVSVHPSVTSIGREAFEGCASLERLTLPLNVTSIDREAFKACSSLRAITLPPNLTSIGNYAFEGCASLRNIILPPNLTSICDFSFNGCTSLTHITLPSNLTSINIYAFKNCTSLESITLPPNVKLIGCHAFKNCPSLRSVMGPTSSNESCHNLHSFLNTMTFCAGDFIELVIRLHPEQLEEADADGNLPLHIAASLSILASSNKKLFIRKLLTAYPEAAKVPNNNGKLPLFMALEGQTQWSDGVEELMKAFPAVTTQADKKTNLFPFMTAALKETGSCLDSIYSLLITCPEMNMFYHNKAQEDNQVGGDTNKDKGSINNS